MKYLLAISILIFFYEPSRAQTKTPNWNDSTAMINWMHQSKVPALGVAYIEKGRSKVMKIYGDRKTGSPALLNTVFNVASITKTITILVTLNLVNAGKWTLDGPVAGYWTDPDLKNDLRSRKLTTRDILTHRTGFPNWRSELPQAKLTFLADPGIKYGYSGEGFEYLRHALENKFHRTLEQLADSVIFKPLDMKDTRLTWDEAEEPRFAFPFDKQGQPLEPTRNTHANAADLMKTTLPDYTKFIQWVISGGGLSKSLFKQMTSHQVNTKAGVYMGLGWAVYDPIGDGEYAISHSGHDPGVHTIVFVLPKSKRALIIFTNSDNGIALYPDLIVVFLGRQGQTIVDTETKR
ncbi:MAG: serine hydrolase domain-containing protein [Mucilaginibacter sp.]|uniref:serine hydrolase domain-containing protein n=1 Tax=Mucilaginibacter sp. TaxID=1882438 RepID=UPI0031A92579